jgi:hypothetical protein
MRQALPVVYKARFEQAKEDYLNQEIAVRGEFRLKRQAFRGTRRELYAFFEKDGNERRLENLRLTEKEWETGTRKMLEQQQQQEEARIDKAIDKIGGNK